MNKLTEWPRERSDRGASVYACLLRQTAVTSRLNNAQTGRIILNSGSEDSTNCVKVYL